MQQLALIPFRPEYTFKEYRGYALQRIGRGSYGVFDRSLGDLCVHLVPDCHNEATALEIARRWVDAKAGKVAA